MAEDALLAEMRALQDKVTGITGTAVASRGGLIAGEDTGGVNPDNLVAIAATWLALAQRMSAEAGLGTLREAMTRSVGGFHGVITIPPAPATLTGRPGVLVASWIGVTELPLLA